MLLDYHTRLIWQLTVSFPYAAICSIGFFAEYNVRSMQVFIVTLIFTGQTTSSIFVYRMRAVTQHVEPSIAQKLVVFARYMVHVLCFIFFVFLILVYPDLRYQDDRKKQIEEKFGSIPDYAWCDNCFFLRFDTWISLTFFISGYCALFCVFIVAVCAALVTFRALSSKSLKLSARTAKIQRNLIVSLVLVTSVHISLVLIPFLFLFAGSFIVIDVQKFATFLVLLLEDHGSFSTFIMVATINVLRRAALQLFRIPMLCPPEGRVSQGTTSGTANVSATTY